MIKKLRRRFIIVNMCILTSVLIGTLSGIFGYMYSSEVKISYELMESILNEKNPGEPDIPPDRENILPDVDVVTEPAEITPMNYEREDLYERPDFDGGEVRRPDDGRFDPDRFDPNRPDQDKPFPDRPDMPPPTDREERRTTVVTTKITPKITPKVTTKITATSEAVTTAGTKPKTTAPVTTASKTQPTSSVTAATTVSAVSTTSATTESTVPAAVKTDDLPHDKPHDNGFPPDGDRPPDFPDPYKGNVKRAYIMVMFGREDDIDKVVYQYFDDADEEEVRKTAKEIISSDYDRGKTEIGTSKLRYMKKFNPRFGGFRLLFLDRTLEISTINRLLFIFIIIGSLGVVVIFGISVLLANWMIKPVDKAWKQQKQFVADASHELKTPLTVISSNTDVILSNADDTVRNQSKWLGYIKEETKRMTKLVNNMLYIAKYDSNEIKFTPKNFDLSDVLSSICLQYEAVLFEKGRLLETDIAEGIFVNGDEDKLKQLINILLDNAGKYSTENGMIKTALSRDQKTGKAILAVSNTSEYIPPDKLEMLFDRFYRLDDSRNRKTGGSGLGLNIARSILEFHGGSICAKHENGITTFIAEI